MKLYKNTKTIGIYIRNDQIIKFQMIFEGLWSQQTHPKDFPPALQLTHFSDIIGCTHSKNITMWAEGQYASEGLRQVAEFGSSSIMESELLDKVIRAVILNYSAIIPNYSAINFYLKFIRIIGLFLHTMSGYQ